jgi:hypothetical protein
MLFLYSSHDFSSNVCVVQKVDLPKVKEKKTCPSLCLLARTPASFTLFIKVNLYLYRGERVNGGHLREMQDKIETIRKVENLHKRAFSRKGVLLKYAVRKALNTTKIF